MVSLLIDPRDKGFFVSTAVVHCLSPNPWICIWCSSFCQQFTDFRFMSIRLLFNDIIYGINGAKAACIYSRRTEMQSRNHIKLCVSWSSLNDVVCDAILIRQNIQFLQWLCSSALMFSLPNGQVSCRSQTCKRALQINIRWMLSLAEWNSFSTVLQNSRGSVVAINLVMNHRFAWSAQFSSSSYGLNQTSLQLTSQCHAAC